LVLEVTRWMRHDFGTHAMLRSVTLVVLLAACKRDPVSNDEPRGAPPPADNDDRCDPRRSRQCAGNDVVACEPDGRPGRRVQACHEGCKDGRCIATCADAGVALIYVVDEADTLLSFDPRKLPRDPFQRIGTLRCGNHGRGPFSMSIDRHGVAWVLYNDGELFQVSIADASCQPTAYVPGAAGFLRFGMGFVTDSPGGTTEKLFLASTEAPPALGYIDPAHDLTPRAVGTLTGAGESNPELTGTSEARLFGFYPMNRGPSFVQEIDRATGAPRGQRWMLGKAPLGSISAYAFAQWAGVFYIFVTSSDGGVQDNSTVRALDRTTGAYRVVLDHLPYRISGAGVSTCAPERDQ
jgi:hypothetical protein